MRRCWESGPKGAGGLEGDKPENGLTLSPNSGEIPGIHPMKAALFSDVHGHLRILLHLIRNWQIAHATHLDAALIAGDLGCFPDPSKFDRATKRWIVRDPEEAGFAKYFTTPLAEVERLFEPEFGEFSAIRCPIVFVPGNHEDYGYIESASKKAPAPNAPENTFPVDCYKRFHCLRDGAFTTLLGEDSVRLRVAGIWGIENAKMLPIKLKTAQCSSSAPKVRRSICCCRMTRRQKATRPEDHASSPKSSEPAVRRFTFSGTFPQSMESTSMP